MGLGNIDVGAPGGGLGKVGEPRVRLGNIDVGVPGAGPLGLA